MFNEIFQPLRKPFTDTCISAQSLKASKIHTYVILVILIETLLTTCFTSIFMRAAKSIIFFSGHIQLFVIFVSNDCVKEWSSKNQA